MALTLGDNFSYLGKKPLDGRIKYSTISEMVAMSDSTLYDGILAYCVADGKNYQWKSTNEVDATLGKWREFSSGGGAVDSVNGKTGAVELNAQDVGALPDDTDIPSNTSDLTNDSGFITNTVNNLLNYYLKSETYTQAEVNALISAIVTLDIQAVSTLPTEDISRTTIYLVPSADPQSQNIKDEYINLDGTSSGWELIGSTEIDLTGYVTDAELTTALADYTTTANLTTLLASKADASDVDDIEALIPSTATTTNKLATMGDVITDFDDLNNRPQESEAIDIDELDLPMPAKPTEYPILFDETGQEYQVSWYRRTDGKVKPIYRKDIYYNQTPPSDEIHIDISNINVDIINEITGCWHRSDVDAFVPINRWTSNTTYCTSAWIYTEDNAKKLNLSIGNGFRTYVNKGYFSIFFTKTTDEYRDL